MDNSKTQTPTLTDSKRYLFGPFSFENAQMKLSRDGELIALDSLPQGVLNMLLERAGEVITKDEFFDVVWADREVEESSLPVAISKIRKALSPDGADFIRTIHRIGYQFIGKVEFEWVQKPSHSLKLTPGDSVPRAKGWTLAERLGTGGYGEAWLAEDESGNQRVFKFATDMSSLRALKRELASYRLIESANPGASGLTPILESQFMESPYFIATPYCGRALDEWNDSTREARIKVVAQVARTLAMAHRVGVLHLDVKPKNILVDLRDRADDPRVHVIDFGSAKVTNSHQALSLGMTLAHSIADSHSDIGSTPVYLAPEVLSGQIATTQSDVYSLGIVLYQAWIGDFSKPLATGWESDVDDPVIRADITAATAGNTDKRLATIDELAQRLDALKQRRADYKLAIENSRKQEELEAELERRRAAQPWIDRTREALKVTKALNRFLIEDLFSAANPDKGGRADISLKEAVDLARSKVSKQFSDNPAIEREITVSLGQLYFELGEFSLAVEQFERTQSLGRPDRKQDNLTAMAWLAIAHTMADNKEAAHDLLNQMVPQTEAVKGSDLDVFVQYIRCQLLMLETNWEQLLPQARNLMALIDKGQEFPRQLRRHIFTVAFSAFVNGRQLDDARDAMERWSIILKDQGEELSYEAMIARRDTGRLMGGQGQWRDAIPVLAEAYKGLCTVVGDSHKDSINTLHALATAKAQSGFTKEAAEDLRVVVKQFSSTLGNEHAFTMMSASDLTSPLLQLGLYEEAIEVLEARRPAFIEKNGAKHFAAIMSGFNLVDAYIKASRLDDADALFQDVKRYGDETTPAKVEWSGNLAFLEAKLRLAQSRTDEGKQLLIFSRDTLKTLGDQFAITISEIDNELKEFPS